MRCGGGDIPRARRRAGGGDAGGNVAAGGNDGELDVDAAAGAAEEGPAGGAVAVSEQRVVELQVVPVGRSADRQ